MKADGSEHEKMNIVSRPYPQRSSGHPRTWSFEFATRKFRFELDAAPPHVTAPTQIFTAKARHYPKGFQLVVDGNPVPADVAQASYDSDGELLFLPAQHKPSVIELIPVA